MTNPLILASGSQIRRQILENAGLLVDVQPVKIDESMIKASLLAEGATPRDVADALAEMKAQKGAMKHPTGLVLGCDQVLSLNTELLSKPETKAHAVEQLQKLSAGKHILLSAAVLYQDQKPVWRFVGKAEMFVRALSDDFIANYVEENWNEIRHCVGCYQIERKGAQLFSRVQGDQFTIMGLSLYELLAYLRVTGHITS